MTVQFKIVFSGKLKEGADQAEFIEKFSRYFKVSDKQAQALIDAGREVVIKKGVSAEEGAKYVAVLEKLGMVVSLEAMEPKGLSLEPMENEAPAEQTEEAEDVKSTCPKCGSERLQDGECLDCGIIVAKYVESAAASDSPPPASDADPYRVTERTRNAEPEPRAELGGELAPMSVPAGHGWTWIADGFDLFRRSALSWLGAMIVFGILTILLNMLPVIGPLIVTLFSPVIGAGFMIGCRDQDHGGDFRVAHLFSGFQENLKQLLLVGAMYLGAMFFIGLLMGITLGSTLATMEGMDQMAAQDPAVVADAINPKDFLLPILIALALFVPVLMAYWFAPALVALGGVSAVEAMKLSFTACLKNILPFLVYGLAVLVLAIVASFVSGILSVASVFLGALVIFLGMLVLIPVLTASIYTSFRDVFRS
jgi:hypothetical protein